MGELGGGAKTLQKMRARLNGRVKEWRVALGSALAVSAVSSFVPG
jgi:hypothetical protein